ncbi:MAG: CDC27 family protein [Myxococcales bacterium]|nr:CDC27 family protein [Myxococcales bacterium]
MGFLSRLFGSARGGHESLFSQAQAAFERDDLNSALTLLMQEAEANPTNVAAHLLTGRCFVKAGRYPQAFQVFSALVLHPEIRGHADLPRDEVDACFVETLLGWASRIEATGFPDAELGLFHTAVAFYEGDAFRGRRTIEIVGLDEGLRRKMPVTETFAGLIADRTP